MDSIEQFIGSDAITLSEAMKRMDVNAFGILFLVTERGELFGCITDGDVRRYLLAGGSMTSLAAGAANKQPKAAASKEEAISLYHKQDYIAIPIVDAQRRIIDVYFGGNKAARPRADLNIPVVINAGGRGTRLDPFTKVLPKPLVPVGDIPIIEHIMKEYLKFACDDFHIIINYKKELIKAYFAENDFDYHITWHEEEKPLGTGGGLCLLKGVLRDTFFFVNCDTLLNTNYESILKFHRENANMITMACAYKNINIPYGVVDIGMNGIIEAMHEKPLMSFLVNTGIYVVEPEAVEDIADGVPMDFPQIIDMERKRGKKAAAFPVSDGDWMDMGQLPELEKMRYKRYGA